MVNGKYNLDKQFTNIYDADVSNNFEVELLVFSNTTNTINLIKREIPFTQFKWNSNFWIYLIIYIHLAALVLGFLHFTLIFHWTPTK